MTVASDSAFADFLPEATRRIGDRDPDDIALLALALVMQIPLWSNDKDENAS